MSVIIEIIIALLPVVIQWLVNMLHQQAATLERTGNDADDAKTLLELVLANLSPAAIIKRGIVRLLISYVPDTIRNKQKKLPDSIITEIVGLHKIDQVVNGD